MKKIAQLRQERKALAEKVRELAPAGGEPYDTAKATLVEHDATIARMVEAQTLAGEELETEVPGGQAREVLQPAQTVQVFGRRLETGIQRSFDQWTAQTRSEIGFNYQADRNFRSFGDMLQAVVAASSNNRATEPDARLVRAPLGAGEVDPTGGGFLVQTDFAQTIFSLAHDMGNILSRVQRLPISNASNGIKIPAVDETSRVTGSRWGGVQSYWVDEGTTATPSKPKFRVIELSLKKLMSTMYITDELLQDTTALTALAGQAFAEEIAFMTEDAVFEGTGVGQPLGVMKSEALISVAKEAGQATQTLTLNNIVTMWSRMWSRSRQNAVWFINQDIEPQLLAMNGTVGLAGQLVFMPPGGISAAPYATLLGKPVIATEFNSTLGTQGDVLLADMSQYLLADKGGVQAATSMHVAFLTDQMTFRITYRVDGKPIWTKPLTPFKGTATKSPFVTLATR